MLALLAACATVPRGGARVVPWPQRLAALQGIDRFTLRGRLAVATGGDGFSAGLQWRQQGADASVDLSAPLGFGGAHISNQAGRLSVTTSRGEVLDGTAALAQLRQTLGFEPPLDSLRYWLLGASDPASASEPTLDEQQRLAALRQEGWELQYSDYVWTQQHWLPRRLTLTRAGVRVRLVVNAWQL